MNLRKNTNLLQQLEVQCSPVGIKPATPQMKDGVTRTALTALMMLVVVRCLRPGGNKKNNNSAAVRFQKVLSFFYISISKAEK